MNIIVTVADASHAVHIGGEVERKSAVITIPDEGLPKIVKDYFRDKSMEDQKANRYSFSTISFSLEAP